MKKRGRKSHWGEFPDLYNPKVEVENCLTILSPEKRAKLESLGPVEDKSPTKRWKLEPVVAKDLFSFDKFNFDVYSQFNYRKPFDYTNGWANESHRSHKNNDRHLQ